MAIDGLLVDVISTAVVSLEDNIRFGAAEGFFQGGILAFFEVFGDVFFRSDNARKSKTRFGESGNVISEKFSVSTIADNDSTESTPTGFEC